MAKTKISEFNANPALNTDIDSINLAEGCSPSGINDAIRELMSQLKDWQAGTSNDPYVIGSSGSLTLNQGTANGVAYLHGSKVVTSGSALTFDGTNLGVGGTGAVPLDVYANSSALNLRLRGRSADSIGQVEFYNNAGSTRYGYLSSESTAITLATVGAIPLNFVTNGSERMRLDASGNLGIGTTSPSSSFGFSRVLEIAGTTAAFVINPSNTTSGGGIEVKGAAPLRFTTNNTEAARIDSSGNLLVGTTTGGGWTGVSKFESSANGTSYAVSGVQFNSSGHAYIARVDSTSSALMRFYYTASTLVGSITTNGTITVYNTTSDYRLKNVTGNLTGYKERLMSLQPKQGTWIVDGSEFRGFLAHDFAGPYRASVTGEKDAVDENGNPMMQSMQASSSEVMADLVALVQEQQAIIESLKARLDAANL